MGAKFIERFKVPGAALDIIDQIVSPPEILLVESVTNESFTLSEAREALQTATGNEWTQEQICALLLSAYQRGVIELRDETYQRFRIGSFYTRLDVFVISESRTYLNLPRETQIALDQWYFRVYLNRLDPDVAAPTADKIATLAQAMAYLDSVTGAIWLNKCDCRTLAGNCDLATDVCISFRSGINTFSHRGWSTPITPAQAKAVLERADRAGLIHTINPGGICNCCSDCCYLFRAQQARKSNPAWPVAPMMAVFQQASCINCGLCIARCPFGAFDRNDGIIQYNPDRCRGCGLCSTTCPAEAITITTRRT